MADQKLNVILGVDSSRFNASLGKAQGRLKAFGSKLKSVGSTLSTRLSLPLALAGGAAISSAAKFEKLRTTLNVLTGSAEKGAKAFEDLVQFSSQTPFQLDELVKANNTMMGFGISSEDALKHLQAIGDIAAVSGGDLQGITVAFSQVAAAGRLMGQDLLQLINNGVPIIDMLSSSMGVAKSEIKEMVSQGAVTFPVLLKAFQESTSEGGKFNNGMKILSGTLSGLGSTLKDNLNIALAELGKEVVEAFDLKENTKKFISFIQDLTDRFKNLSPQTKKISIIIAGIGIAIGPVLIAIGALSSAFGIMASGFGIVVSSISFLTGAFKTLTIAMSTNPVILIGTAIATLTLGFVELLHKMNPIISRFQTFTNLLKSSGDMTKFAALQAETHANNILRDRKEQEKANKAKEEAESKVSAYEKSLKKLNNTITTGTIPALQKVATVSILPKDFSDLTPLETGMAKIKSIFSKNDIGTGELTGDTTGISNLTKQLSVEGELYKSKAQEFVNSAANIIQEGTVNTLSNMAAGIGEMLSGAGGGMGDFSTMLMSGIANMAIQLGKLAIATGISIKGIKEALASLNPAVAIVAGIALVALGSAVKGQMKSMSGGGGGGVPAFANGGIVSGPTLGLMGEYSGAKSNPEVIAPLNKLEGMIGQKQTNVNVGGSFRIQGQDLVLALQKADKQRNRII